MKQKLQSLKTVLFTVSLLIALNANAQRLWTYTYQGGNGNGNLYSYYPVTNNLPSDYSPGDGTGAQNNAYPYPYFQVQAQDGNLYGIDGSGYIQRFNPNTNTAGIIFYARKKFAGR